MTHQDVHFLVSFLVFGGFLVCCGYLVIGVWRAMRALESIDKTLHELCEKQEPRPKV